MGLIRATSEAMGSTMADQWKEYISCDGMTGSTVIVKGTKKTSTKSSNKDGSDTIITKGSIIAVNEGEAMMIVEDGKIAEFCAEAGSYTYDNSTEGSVFEGGLGSSIKQTFSTFGKRFTFGGDTGHAQTVYYVNLKELSNNKFGSSNPIPYDDPIYQSIAIRYFGNATLRIKDPIKFFMNVSGNVKTTFGIENYWENTLKTEFSTYLVTALAKLANDGIKFTQIPQNLINLTKYMNEVMDEEWVSVRGLEVGNVGISSVTLDPKFDDKIRIIDEENRLSDPNKATGRMVAAQARAMETAAGNTGGAMTGFMGMNMANQSGASTVSNMFAMNQANQQQTQQSLSQSQSQLNEPIAKDANSWICSCNTVNTGKFCNDCGNKKPEDNSWNCSCGVVNTGKFCSDCGNKKPENTSWNCSCGAINTGKFCNECGSKNE